MARYSTANDIINRAAVESGLSRVNDPLSSIDDAFIQLAELLNGAGQELVELFPWQQLISQYEIITQSGDSGEYDLPDDFSYMIDQTGWDRVNNLPIGGPLSAQDWTYLKGRDLVSSTIYASFRELDGKLFLFPTPPPVGLRVTFEYMSRSWVQETGTGTRRDSVDTGDDTVLFEPILMVKFLKLKFLTAKGFDASAAAMEFDNILQSRMGKNTGAPILSASNSVGSFPYLNPYYNVGDTNYGR